MNYIWDDCTNLVTILAACILNKSDSEVAMEDPENKARQEIDAQLESVGWISLGHAPSKSSLMSYATAT